MRKLMMAAVAVAGLGLTVGCQDRNKEIQNQREDVAEVQREAAEKTAQADREALDTRQEAQKEVVEERRELAEVQADKADAEHKAMGDDEATGGSGMAANVQKEEVKGTIQSASASSVTLRVPDKNNQMMRFQANPRTQVMKDDKPVALTDLKPGDEVRASYDMDQNGKMVLRSIELKKESAQHPGQQKK
ncbi:DUF5666 domain-containing protein [Archangium sp.]|uniref:DUF5666 domain-containing protein n=1 Tax=Archangium sp. TaxID=1872627 RepID=UPI00286BC35E|nr:DUF5666 domain-containing protein [Archangium sp.]